MEYTFETIDRPFRAILAGTKKVEGRTKTDTDKTPYDEMKPGDTITIINNSSGENIKVIINFIHHYSDVKKMLETEGPENVLSSEPKTVEHGSESYGSINGYKEGIRKNGIYAIGVEVI